MARASVARACDGDLARAQEFGDEIDGWMEVKLGLHVSVGGADCTLHIASITAIDLYQLIDKQ